MNPDAHFWDGIAERYARKPVPNLDVYQRKLAITKAKLAPQSVVLDVGCGTGSLALELAPHVSHVHAIDLSGEMIKIAERKAKDQEVDNVSFYRATLDDRLPFDPLTFDGVCAYNLLHLVSNRSDALDKIFGLLKPSGFFISSTVCLGESLVPYGLILPVMRWLGKAPAVQIFGSGTIEEEIRRAGFVDISSPDVGAKKTTAFLQATKPQ